MASEIVKYDSKFKDVILLSLGSTIVVDTVDNAILMSKIKEYGKNCNSYR